MTSSVLYCSPTPSEKGYTIKGKNFIWTHFIHILHTTIQKHMVLIRDLGESQTAYLNLCTELHFCKVDKKYDD